MDATGILKSSLVCDLHPRHGAKKAAQVRMKVWVFGLLPTGDYTRDTDNAQMKMRRDANNLRDA
jgi:hypothetical protein